MRNIKEYEMKKILTKKEYDNVYIKLNSIYTNENTITQINYYYDTNKFNIYQNNESLRVRHKRNTLNLQYKYNRKTENNITISDEYDKKIDIMPSRIILNGEELRQIGSLVTRRTNFIANDLIISLDENYYCGIVDYEIEIEKTDRNIVLPEQLKALDFDEVKIISKYNRFVNEFLHNNKMLIINI